MCLGGFCSSQQEREKLAIVWLRTNALGAWSRTHWGRCGAAHRLRCALARALQGLAVFLNCWSVNLESSIVKTNHCSEYKCLKRATLVKNKI